MRRGFLFVGALVLAVVVGLTVAVVVGAGPRIPDRLPPVRPPASADADLSPGTTSVYPAGTDPREEPPCPDPGASAESSDPPTP